MMSIMLSLPFIFFVFFSYYLLFQHTSKQDLFTVLFENILKHIMCEMIYT